VGFVVNKVALGQVLSKYFGFPCHYSSHQLLHIHHLSSGAATIGQLVADVPSGLSLTPSQEKKLVISLQNVTLATRVMLAVNISLLRSVIMILLEHHTSDIKKIKK
jgi:hypothetical protein